MRSAVPSSWALQVLRAPECSSRVVKAHAHVPRCAPQAMSESLMYRLCYYRFADMSERNTGRRGYDRVRNADIGLMDFKCDPARLGCKL